jgi:tetratricopeptide (TPR) repeat protein
MIRPNIAEALTLAVQYHLAGNLHVAEQLYQQIVQADPTYAEAHHLLGVVAALTGRHAQAITSIRQALLLKPDLPEAHCYLGMLLADEGKEDEAVSHWRQALVARWDYPEAHNNLGNALVRLGQLDDAVACHREALRINPNFADGHNGLGCALLQQGQVDEALRCFREALRLQPDLALAHNNLGNALARQERAEEAIACYQEALRLQPNFPQASTNLGGALALQGKLAEAVPFYRQALVSWPDFAEAHTGLGNVLSSQDNLDEAVTHYQHALRVRPDYPEAHFGLGNALVAQGRLPEAVAHYRDALRFKPDYAEAHSNLGGALVRQDQLETAVTCGHEALRIRPDYPEAHNNLGSALLRLGKLDEAAMHFQRALELKPTFTDAIVNLGTVRKGQRRFDEALACIDQALRQQPAQPQIHINLALLRLLLGDWEQGWAEYEWRFQIDDFQRGPLPQPRWDGSPLAGRTLLVLAEQGLGDTLFFLRYVLFLQSSGERVIFQCQRPLLRFLTDFLGKDCLVVQGERLSEFDVCAPVLSLPRILGTCPTNVPAPVPYLHARPNLVEHWRRELSECDARRATCDVKSVSSNIVHRASHFARVFKIGIAWQGSRVFIEDRQRSIPLTLFARLARVPGVELISLQKGPGTEQLSAVSCQLSDNRQLTADRFNVLDLGSGLDDMSGPFVDTAAVMMNLDLVISSDTAIPHLAGALGVPVWVALSLVPDWRWLLERDDSPWYPSMRLFRQKRFGHWDDVFERMAEELAAVAVAEH